MTRDLTPSPDGQSSVRVGYGEVVTEPYASRTHCANGHPWTRESTRWRVRHDKGERTATRDCLVCKRQQRGERKKRKSRAAQ